MTTARAPASVNPTTTLRGPRLFLARLGWAFLALTFLALLVLIAPRNPRLLLFDPLIEDSYQLLAGLLDYRAYLRYIVFLRYLVAGFYFLVAGFIFWRRSNDWLAMLTSISLICMPYIILFGGALFELSTQFDQAVWVMIADGYLMAAGFFSIPLLLFFFPDGQFQPARFKGIIFFLLAMLLIFVLIPQPWELDPSRNSAAAVAYFVAVGILLLTLCLGIFGQVHRYLRVSTPAQRQQTKVVVFAILVSLGWVLFLALRPSASLRFQAASIYGLFELHASLVVAALIPIAMAISILRYHLYDIDLIIRRTLIYSALTFTLGTLYLAAIILLQGIVRTQTGQESSLVIVISTLAIAALVNPFHRRIQDFIDRRFFRRKYDAQKIIESFTTKARSETDLEQLSQELLLTCQKTMQPEQISFWLVQNPNITQSLRKSTEPTEQ